jgi:predicted site-specific integrase-resolvase
MKLSTYAKELGISYKTAWRYWKDGKLDAYQLPSGTVIVREKALIERKVCIYARVSSAENKNNLESQAERLKQYCMAKGYKIRQVIKEIGSGVNDNRARLLKLLGDDDCTLIVVEHKDRLTRFGFNYIKTLLNKQGKDIEVVNEADNGKDDLMQDFVSIITSFCARLYGLRRSKRKTEKLIKELIKDDTLSKDTQPHKSR